MSQFSDLIEKMRAGASSVISGPPRLTRRDEHLLKSAASVYRMISLGARIVGPNGEDVGPVNSGTVQAAAWASERFKVLAEAASQAED